MLEISKDCHEAFQAPLRQQWIQECSAFLSSRPELASIDPPVDTAKFALFAYDWAVPHGLSASESLTRLAYLSCVLTPVGAAPINPLETFDLPATDETLRALEQEIVQMLGDR